jgi:ABC-type amino acid transport substrate-binding protein
MQALDEPVLSRIAEKGILRIGYHPDNLPMSFFNASDELVGYDIDMAHLLAGQLGYQLEFVPFKFSTLPEQLNKGEIDIAMSGITMLPTRLTMMSFSDPYMDVTAAIVVRDHRREEFRQRIVDGDFMDIKLAVARSSDISKIGATLLPGAEFVQVSSVRQFCEDGGDIADGMIWSAESGSAWTLLYPEFSVVPIKPLYRVPVGYAVSQRNTELAAFVSQWLTFVKAGPADERLYDHWILGKNSEQQETRWSVIRDVLHWVD